MSAFTEFVERELPRRGPIITDPDLETVIVRRGVFVRELQGVTINEEEVVGKVGGVITSISLADGSLGNITQTLLDGDTEEQQTVTGKSDIWWKVFMVGQTSGDTAAFELHTLNDSGTAKDTIFAELGDKILVSVDTSIVSGTDIRLEFTNNSGETVDISTRLIAAF